MPKLCKREEVSDIGSRGGRTRQHGLQKEEEERTGEVSVVHKMLVDSPEGVQHGECLSSSQLGDNILVEGTTERSEVGWLVTFDLMCENSMPSSTSNGGSPSYPSAEKAAIQPVRSPPCSPILPDTPDAPPKPELKPLETPYPPLVDEGPP